MRGDKRKARRHRMRVDARMVLDSGELCECALSDVSDRGACINVHDSQVIPDNFLLLLAGNGAARRKCRVIWRKPQQLGVKFETWLDERVQAARAPKNSASGDPASKKVEPAASDA